MWLINLQSITLHWQLITFQYIYACRYIFKLNFCQFHYNLFSVLPFFFYEGRDPRIQWITTLQVMTFYSLKYTLGTTTYCGRQNPTVQLYCAKVMQAKCTNFVLCSHELSIKSLSKSSSISLRHFER